MDGLGGTSGPFGWQAADALDGEVALLAGRVDKGMLFRGGAETVARSGREARELAVRAYVESAAKAVAQLRVAAPRADEVLVSGRGAADAELMARLQRTLSGLGMVRRLEGFALVAKQGAQGAALVADGLVGGRHQALVQRLRIGEAQGTVLDHLHPLIEVWGEAGPCAKEALVEAGRSQFPGALADLVRSKEPAWPGAGQFRFVRR